MNLYPTRTCFDDMVEYLEALARANDPAISDESLRLVHGLIESSESPGTWVAHAWVERAGQVWASGLTEQGAKVLYCVSTTEYYATLGARVKDITRYTLRQLLEENRKSGTTGPWKPEYTEACAARGSLTR